MNWKDTVSIIYYLPINLKIHKCHHTNDAIQSKVFRVGRTRMATQVPLENASWHGRLVILPGWKLRLPASKTNQHEKKEGIYPVACPIAAYLLTFPLPLCPPQQCNFVGDPPHCPPSWRWELLQPSILHQMFYPKAPINQPQTSFWLMKMYRLGPWGELKSTWI